MSTITEKSKVQPNMALALSFLLQEVRLLRSELALLLPSEKLEEYSHPAQIKKSLAKALAKYPPAAAWK